MHTNYFWYRYNYTFIALRIANRIAQPLLKSEMPTWSHNTIEPQTSKITFTPSVCLHKHLFREFMLLLKISVTQTNL